MRNKNREFKKTLAVAGKILLLILFSLIAMGQDDCGRSTGDLPVVEITFHATLDGKEWEGPLRYTVTGLSRLSAFYIDYPGESGYKTFDGVEKRVDQLGWGAYMVTYNSGGPEGALFSGIFVGDCLATSPTVFVTIDDSKQCKAEIYFIFVSRESAPGEITVKAKLDGEPWEGEVRYTIQGPTRMLLEPWDPDEWPGGYWATPELGSKQTWDSVTRTFVHSPPGTYTIAYDSGGPRAARFKDISPSPTRELAPAEVAEFTLNFVYITGNIAVAATLDGQPWTGPVSYTVDGHKTVSGSSAPQTFTGLPIGTYTLTYTSGGPPGALFSGISPSTTEELSEDETAKLTLAFVSVGDIEVAATLDSEPWTGEVSYTIKGPGTESGSSAPHTFTGLPIGNYTLTDISGGPEGALLSGISPSITEELSAGETAKLTLAFVSAGNIAVDATLDGQPWTGEVSYTITQPMDQAEEPELAQAIEKPQVERYRGFGTESGSTVPQSFTLPVGTYTVTGISGGPQGAVLKDILPSTTELSAGEAATFTLNYVSPSITVKATLDGKPWEGNVSYTLEGPRTEAGSSAPHTFSGLPIGTYTIADVSGGPEGALLSGISPTTQEPSTDEAATFTLNYVSTGEITVKASLNDEWWEGALSYSLEGPGMADGASVPQTFSELPAGTYTITDISGGPEGARFFSVWPSNRVEISAGETATFTLIFVPIVAPDVADLSVTKTVNNPNPSYGDNVTYTITVTNSGPDTATNVQVIDILPTGVNYSSDTPSQGTYASGTGVWNVGTLASGNSATLQITVTVAAESGSVTNTAELTTVDQADPDSAPDNNAPTEDDQDDATITVATDVADLSVTKTVNNPNPEPDQDISYFITVTNNGPSDATNIKITDVLPDGVSCAGYTPDQGEWIPFTGIWDVGTLGSGASATLQIDAIVAYGTGGQTITNTAEITAVDQGDPDTGNNQASVDITVPGADLSVTKTVDDPTPKYLYTITYTITVTNSGPNTATGIQVTDFLPGGVTYVSDNVSQGTYDNLTGIWDVGSLDIYDNAVLQIEVTVNAGPGTTITNTAEITAVDQGDPDSGNNQASVDITVPGADLSVTMTVNNPNPSFGDNITYTLTVTNNGPSTVWAILVDTMPAGSKDVSSTGGGVYAAGSGTVTWDLGTLAASTDVTVELTLTPGAPGTTINYATVSPWDQTDPDWGNNTTSLTIIVSGGVP